MTSASAITPSNPSRRRLRYAASGLALAAALVAASACGGNSAGIDAQDLVGEWVVVEGMSVGARTGTPSGGDHANESGNYIQPNVPAIEWTLRITEAGDRGFIGEWCSPKLCEPLAGAVRKDGSAVMADEDSLFTLTRDGSDLELCVTSAGKNLQIAVCHTMRRS